MEDGLLYYSGWTLEAKVALAFEEEQLATAAQGSPVLVCSSWERPVMVIGYGQAAESVSLPACQRLAIPVLRRITGGTGVLHHQAISISLALPSSHPWAATISSLYDGFTESIRAALSGKGLTIERGHGHGGGPRERSPICFEDQLTESLLTGGRKVLGCAQARRNRSVLVHGTLLLGLDAKLQAAAFGVEEERIINAMAPLPPECSASAENDIARRLAEGAGFPLVKAEPPKTVSAEYLARYSTRRWALLP